MLQNVVIAGASLAGLRAAETLRLQGFDGTITLVNGEAHLPYDRPPLSKRVLAGDLEHEAIKLRKDADYEPLDLDIRFGRLAIALDVAAQTVTLDDGDVLPYDGLIIATGATPRRIPGTPDLEGIYELRTIDDSLALRAELDKVPSRVVVIGAGFIGAEVAATARKRGLEVTILEALPVPLVRALGNHMGAACAAVHADHGVEVRTSTGVDAIEGAGRVERLRLSDGSSLDAEVVVVGIGVIPNTSWLEGSGLTIRDGVVCDETLAAGPPGVYCAGDVARWPNPLFGEEMRVEHFTNANEQGAAAASNLLLGPGNGVPYAPVPFFWSDQYDTRIQFLGRAHGEDEVKVVHGSVDERKFVALYGREGRLVGALGMSVPKLLMPYRKLLEARVSWNDALSARQ
ncbi:MAG TPA: FAD-dependent oxidoreductase [Acidimicrobiales bacterium]|nr:FAD-dependent oxidoreductase [Acidimicrobiales bacterium]